MRWNCGWVVNGFKEAKRENTPRDMEKHKPRQQGKLVYNKAISRDNIEI